MLIIHDSYDIQINAYLGLFDGLIGKENDLLYQNSENNANRSMFTDQNGDKNGRQQLFTISLEKALGTWMSWRLHTYHWMTKDLFAGSQHASSRMCGKGERHLHKIQFYIFHS